MTLFGNFPGFVKIGGYCSFYLPIPIIWDQVSCRYHFLFKCMVKIPTFLGVITINLTKGYLQERIPRPDKEKEEDNKQFWVLSVFISITLFTTYVVGWSISRKLTQITWFPWYLKEFLPLPREFSHKSCLIHCQLSLPTWKSSGRFPFDWNQSLFPASISMASPSFRILPP